MNTRIGKILELKSGITNENYVPDMVYLKPIGGKMPRGKIVGKCEVTGNHIVQPQSPFPPALNTYKSTDGDNLYSIPSDMIDFAQD